MKGFFGRLKRPQQNRANERKHTQDHEHVELHGELQRALLLPLNLSESTNSAHFTKERLVVQCGACSNKLRSS